MLTNCWLFCVAMRQTLVLVALFASHLLKAQSFSKGQIVVRKFLAPSLQGNHAGENPERRISVYLPPGYETAGKFYRRQLSY